MLCKIVWQGLLIISLPKSPGRVQYVSGLTHKIALALGGQTVVLPTAQSIPYVEGDAFTFFLWVPTVGRYTTGRKSVDDFPSCKGRGEKSEQILPLIMEILLQPR